ncbi:TPA_asm: hypothetical protein G0D50_20735 [Salmonella enterica subsp. enterica serovar Dublin]|nr:hypothetical protein [Salmonella enterica subsp. enterica serovar Dublin]
MAQATYQRCEGGLKSKKHRFYRMNDCIVYKKCTRNKNGKHLLFSKSFGFGGFPAITIHFFLCFN